MQLTAKELRLRYSELRDLVNAWDPVGLIADGAPEDEYDCVVGPTLRRLESRESSQAIADFLDHEFRDHFGCEPPSDSRAFAQRALSWYAERWPDSESTPRGDSL